jgi:hypothetical protein
MTYAEIVTEIIARAGYSTSYSNMTTRAQSAFINAVEMGVAQIVAQLKGAMLSGSSIESALPVLYSDIPECVLNDSVTLASTGILAVLGASNDLTGDPNVLLVVSVSDPAEGTTSEALVFRFREPGYMAKVSTSSYLAPQSEEVVYWTWNGANVVFYPKATVSGKTANVIAIISPSTTGWASATDMIGLYSRTFIEQAIETAVSKLISETSR